jgi:molybdate-binding protein/DNA-binding XRE family transcriptional regulator
MISTIVSERSKAEPAANIENRLRSLRTQKGISQSTLAAAAGITRQAVCAIEANRYLPTTAIALRLAAVLNCRVEDLFNLLSMGETIEGDLLGTLDTENRDPKKVRVKVARVGDRMVVRPVAVLGEILTYAVPADGLIVGRASHGVGTKNTTRVKVQLLRDRHAVEQEIAVAGCDPAIFLVGEHLRRRRETTSVIGWTMGSLAAVEALKRGEVHVAGLHVVDARSGESNLPFLRQQLKNKGYTVVTFATWQEGLLIRNGNPKGIRGIEDLARKDVSIANRETGAGARLLLDQELASHGIAASRVKGYQRLAGSHLEVARLVAEGAADTGVGTFSAARAFLLDFLPLQTERYDLVVPTPLLQSHPGLEHFIDTIVSRPFRTEIAALDGYDTRDTGKVQQL